MTQNQPSLLLVAHGSRREQSNDEVRALVRHLRQLGQNYGMIECAFLELAEPSIADGLRGLVVAGASDIVVMPYFLAAGRHVVADIPREVDEVRHKHPEVTIRVAPYLGAAPDISRLILAQAERAMNRRLAVATV